MNRPIIEGENRQDFYRNLTDGRGENQCFEFFLKKVSEWGFDRVDRVIAETYCSDVLVSQHLKDVMTLRLKKQWIGIEDLSRSNSTYVHQLLGSLENLKHFLEYNDLHDFSSYFEKEGGIVLHRLCKSFYYEISKGDISRALVETTEYYQTVFQRLDQILEFCINSWNIEEKILLECFSYYEKMEDHFFGNIGNEVFHYIPGMREPL